NFYQQTWRTYGDYVRIRVVPRMDLYFLADPAAVEHVLFTHHKNYRKPDFFNKTVRLLAGNGIITSEGDFWLRQRRLSQPAFLRQRLAGVGARTVAAVEALLAEWEKAPSGRTVDVLPEMMRLGLRIAGTALFSTDVSGDADDIGHAFRVAFEHISDKMNGRLRAPSWVPTRRNREFRRCKAHLDRVVLELIEARRRARPATEDVLDQLQ